MIAVGAVGVFGATRGWYGIVVSASSQEWALRRERRVLSTQTAALIVEIGRKGVAVQSDQAEGTNAAQPRNAKVTKGKNANRPRRAKQPMHIG